MNRTVAIITNVVLVFLLVSSIKNNQISYAEEVSIEKDSDAITKETIRRFLLVLFFRRKPLVIKLIIGSIRHDLVQSFI